MKSTIHRLLSFLCACALLVQGARATWSIILIDTRTGEIAIGCATCLQGFDLLAIVPILRLGSGAGCAQSFVNPTGQNRLLIWDELGKGTDPAQILVLLAQQDPGHQSRQYGIVDVLGRVVAHTGTQNGAFAGHRTGQIGTITYSIQGNVLTGAPVVQAAEQAVLNTPGDLGSKLMAAMQAAKFMGGDGRCSCGTFNPTGCGSPPPSFQKSAHVGFMVVARLGDNTGICQPTTSGCATGGYYMRLNIAFQAASAPDPVDQLQALYNVWRQNLVGVADHHLSTVEIEPPTLPPDAKTEATIKLTLRDWGGIPLNHGGAAIQVFSAPTSTASIAQIGPTIDHGDGTYTLKLRAGFTPGTARLRIRIIDGVHVTTLAPYPEIEVTSDPLWAHPTSLSATGGGHLDFSLVGGNARAGKSYLMLASAAGSTPGFMVGTQTIPLNPDPLMNLMFGWAVSGALPGFVGTFDGFGRAWTALDVPPFALTVFTGTDLTFAYATVQPVDFVSQPLVVSITP